MKLPHLSHRDPAWHLDRWGNYALYECKCGARGTRAHSLTGRGPVPPGRPRLVDGHGRPVMDSGWVKPNAAEILPESESESQDQERTGSLPHPLDKLNERQQRTILDMLAQLPPRDREPTLRRLIERVEAGELEHRRDTP